VAWVLIIVLLIALVAAGVVIARQRRSQQLQEGFGPEYGRTLAERGDRRAAESELRERRERHEQLEIRELEPEARERYSERWRGAQRRFVDQPAAAVAEADALVSEVMRERRERHEQLEIRELEPDARERFAERWRGAQRTFVDQPAAAVAEADALVSEVMRERGYPVEDDFDRRAADISVEHPVVVENYRSAHEISGRAVRNEAGTEDLRQAMIHFRELFEELLGADDQPRSETSEDINQETPS
jgi:hypothetical protein